MPPILSGLKRMLKYAPNAEFQFKRMMDVTIWVVISAVTNFVGFVLICGQNIKEITTLAIKYFF